MCCGCNKAYCKRLNICCSFSLSKINPVSLLVTISILPVMWLHNNIYINLQEKKLTPANAIHPAAIIDASASIAEQGVMIAANAVINPLATIGTGAICNTGCIIEHECVVGEFAHIGPGAVLCGNVKIGSGTFVGANAVIKQGITVGKNAMIGAGAVVVKNVPDNVTVVGVPAK